MNFPLKTQYPPDESDFEKIEVPGFPPMYNHEMFPQPIRLTPDDFLVELGRIYTREGDGVIFVTSSVYEQSTITSAKSWLTQIGKPSYALFPLSIPKPKHRLDEDREGLEFLDGIQSRFGAKLLIYVSELCLSWHLSFLIEDG